MVPILNRIMLPPPGPDGRITSELVVLDENETPGTESDASPRPLELSVGDRGVALSLLRPAGKAEINNRRVDVVTDGDFIKSGEKVEVVEISGNRVVVILAK